MLMPSIPVPSFVLVRVYNGAAFHVQWKISTCSQLTNQRTTTPSIRTLSLVPNSIVWTCESLVLVVVITYFPFGSAHSEVFCRPEATWF